MNFNRFVEHVLGHVNSENVKYTFKYCTFKNKKQSNKGIVHVDLGRVTRHMFRKRVLQYRVHLLSINDCNGGTNVISLRIFHGCRRKREKKKKNCYFCRRLRIHNCNSIVRVLKD